MASETRAADTGSTGRGSRSPDRVTVGRDVLVGGRLARLLYAAAAVWYRVDKDLRLDNGYVLSTVLWFLVVCAGYLALYRLVLVRVLVVSSMDSSGFLFK